MASVKLLLNRDRALRDGSYPLVFQLIQNRRKRLIYTSFRLFPEEFDAVRGKVLGGPGSRRGEREVQRMNRQLSQQRRSIESHIAALEARGSGYSVEEIVFRYRADHGGLGLLHYMDVQIERRRQAERYGMEAALRHTRGFAGGVHRASCGASGGRERPFCPGIRRFSAVPGREPQHDLLLHAQPEIRLAAGRGRRLACRPAYHPFEHVRSKPRKTVKRALDRFRCDGFTMRNFRRIPAWSSPAICSCSAFSAAECPSWTSST